MNVKTLQNLRGHKPDEFIYESAVYWIAKSEEKIVELESQVILSYDELIGFMYKGSDLLLEEEQRNLKELNEFKANLEKDIM